MGRIPAIAACALVALAAPAGATEFTDDRFEDVILAEGLDDPTSIALGPSGRIYVAEQAGRVRMLAPDGTLHPDPVADIAERVNAAHERGLLGLAVDRSLPYLYLLYTHEDDPARPLAPKLSRLVRLDMAPDGTVVDDADETVLIDGIPAEDFMHSIGTVRQADDGTLYVGTGDALDTGGAYDDPRAHRPSDPASYAGKVLRVDRDGHGVPGHPFCPEAPLTAPCARVFALGFRNPFRFSVRPGGGLVLGDVGSEDWEEINLVEGGGDYGWPCWEGLGQTFQFSWRATCHARYAQPPPALRWPRVTHRGRRGGEGGASIYGGPEYTSGAFPAALHGRAFYGDTVRGWLRHVAPDGTAPGEPFATGVDYAVDLVEGTAGELLYLELLPPGRLRAIRFAPLDKTPVARAVATPSSGAGVSSIAFDAGDSSDPDGDTLSYAWEFGDGSTGTGVAPVHEYAAPGRYVARVTVSAGSLSAAAQVVVFPGHDPPEVSLDAPVGGTFRAGDTVPLKASGTAVSWSWFVSLIHDDHLHPLGRFLGPEASFTTLDTHDLDSHYAIRLRGTSAIGLTVERNAEIRPQGTTVTLASSPPGARLLWGQRELTAPATFEAATGMLGGLTADSGLFHDGRWWPFDHWEHGAGRLGYARVPDMPVTFTAVYRPPEAGEEARPDEPLEALGPPPTGVLGTVPFRRAAPSVALHLFRRHLLRGTATDPDGVRAVRVTLSRAGHRRTHAARLGRGTSPRWWSVTLRRPLRPGRYAIRVRTTGATGAASARTFHRRVAHPPSRRAVARGRGRRR